MQIEIPEILAGGQAQAGGAIAKALGGVSDFLTEEIRKEDEKQKNTDNYIAALQHEEKLYSIYNKASEQVRNMSYDDIQQAKDDGSYPMDNAKQNAIQYLNGIKDVDVRSYAAQKLAYVQYRQDQRVQAIEEHKRTTAGQLALEQSLQNDAEDTATGYKPQTLDENDKENNNRLNFVESMQHQDNIAFGVDGKLGAAANAGLITAHQLQAYRKQYFLNSAIAISRNDPKAAREYLARQQGQMSELDFKASQATLQEVIRSAALTNSVKSLQDEYNLNQPDANMEGAIRATLDPKNWEKYGIPDWDTATHIVGTLHNAYKTAEAEKTAKQKALADDAWENAIAPLLLKSNFSAAYKKLDTLPLNDGDKLAIKDNIKSMEKRWKAPQGEGDFSAKWFDAGDLPTDVMKSKDLTRYTLAEIAKLETRVKPELVKDAYDTAMENLRTLAVEKNKAGGKIVGNDIWQTFTSVLTDPKFLKKAKKSLADVMGDKSGNAAPMAPSAAKPGAVPSGPVRRQKSESLDDFNRRTGAQRIFDINDLSGIQTN